MDKQTVEFRCSYAVSRFEYPAPKSEEEIEKLFLFWVHTAGLDINECSWKEIK